MSNKKKQYSAQFKAKVALEAIRGEKTVSELASQYEIHPTMINGWKRKIWSEASQIFETEKQGKEMKYPTAASCGVSRKGITVIVEL